MKKTDRLPWQINPVLTQHRLVVLAEALWVARRSAAQDANWKKGDSRWSVGCVAYERSCHALAKAALVHSEWLSVKRRNHQIVINVRGVPLRFYRGDPEQPAPGKIRCPNTLELFSMNRPFDLFYRPAAFLRLVVETDLGCAPISVTFCQVDAEGNVFNKWRIPVDEDSAVRPLGYEREEAVKLEAPLVGEEVTRRHETDEAIASEDV